MAAMTSTRLHYPGEVSAEENGPWRSAASVPARSKAAAGASHARARLRCQGTTLAASVCGLPSAISKQLRATGNTTELRTTVDSPGERAAGRPPQ